jgi:hypothetical protein
MSGNVHVRLREKVDGNGLVVPYSRLQWGLLFFFGRVCQYDLNERSMHIALSRRLAAYPRSSHFQEDPLFDLV